ncbi:MAG: MBL fold metallo-hydrolase, partial [Gammaproteobacteria bacterium]
MTLKRLSLCILLAIGLCQPVKAAESAKAASETTKGANAAMLEALPFDDQSTFEDARRGFIAPLPNNGLVKDAKGNVVWDSSKWDFLGDEPSAAPETVNPSLWRQAQLLKISG